MYDPNKIDKPVAWDDDKAAMPDFYRKEYYVERGVPEMDDADTACTLEQIMEIKALAYGSTTAIDDSIGGIIDHLKQQGRYEDTVFIFTSDHGEAGGDHRMTDKGPFHYDGIVRIPFIVAYPEKLPKGRRSQALVSLLDFMPTILDLAAVEYPAQQSIKPWQGAFPNQSIYPDDNLLPGHSLKPILTGEKEELQDYVLIEDDEDTRQLCLRTLVTHQYKLTIYKDKEYGVLFDRLNDPEERHNVYDDPRYAPVKAMLKDKMNHALLNNMERLNRKLTIA